MGVADGVLNVLVTQVMLNRTRVLSSLGQLVSTGVPQHVRVDREWEFGLLPCPGQNFSNRI